MYLPITAVVPPWFGVSMSMTRAFLTAIGPCFPWLVSVVFVYAREICDTMVTNSLLEYR